MDIAGHLIFNLLLSSIFRKKYKPRLLIALGGIFPDFFFWLPWLNRYFFGGTVVFIEFMGYLFHGFFGYTLILFLIAIISIYYNSKIGFNSSLLILSGCFLHSFLDSISHSLQYPQYVFFPIMTPINVENWYNFGLYWEGTLILLVYAFLFSLFFLISKNIRENKFRELKKFRVEELFKKSFDLEDFFLVSLIISGIMSFIILSIVYYFDIPYPNTGFF